MNWVERILWSLVVAIGVAVFIAITLTAAIHMQPMVGVGP